MAGRLIATACSSRGVSAAIASVLRNMRLRLEKDPFRPLV